MMANVSKIPYAKIEEAFDRYRGDLTFEKYGKTVHLRVEKTPLLLRPPGPIAARRVQVESITFA